MKVLTVILVGVGLSLSLAHALELPASMRLTREGYFAAQKIYYPGFTVGGGIGEGGRTIAAKGGRPPFVQHPDWAGSGGPTSQWKRKGTSLP
jgi:hypothetical protein